MKKNKLLILSLLACTLLTSCDETTKVQNGSDPVGNVNVSGSTDKGLDTILNLQDFYEQLKESNGGSKVVEKIIEKIASIEYSDEELSKLTVGDKFDVRDYHTTETLRKEITEKFENYVKSNTYNDDDGNFDPEAFKEYVEETLDFEADVADANGQPVLTSSKYINDDELRAKLVYNYDEFIEKSIKPDILESYLYLDYVTSLSKYKGQFSNQYAVKLEVLKIEHDTTKLNGAWNEALVKDVKAMTSGKENVTFGTDYSFVTFNSNNDLVVFETAASELKYSVYPLSEEDVKKYVPSYATLSGSNEIKQLDLANSADAEKVDALRNNVTPTEAWTITPSTPVDGDYFKNIETVLIARKLWKIDHEVVLAKNYDFKTDYYKAMTETEKSEAQSLAGTYSNSNSKPITQVAKEKKISAQQSEYYSKPDYYTKSTYTSVLPSALSSLRGTSAKDLQSHLREFNGKNYLLPSNDSIVDPVYLDTSSNNYYICTVPQNGWYGLYLSENLLDSSVASKQSSNYHIETYQSGLLKAYKLNDSKTAYIEDSAANINYADHPEAFEDVIKLVQVSAKNILTDSIRKEAIVSLFEKYSLEINDQDIYDYISQQYPDYFDDED